MVKAVQLGDLNSLQLRSSLSAVPMPLVHGEAGGDGGEGRDVLLIRVTYIIISFFVWCFLVSIAFSFIIS